MRQLVSLLVLAAFLNLLAVEAFGSVGPKGNENSKEHIDSAQPSDIPADTAEPAASSGLPSPAMFSPEEEAFLDSVFTDFTVPPADIAVLENALGDMNQDDVVSIFDLLRIRNIALGKAPAASAYEKNEGDLNQDLVIDEHDVTIIRDVLLRKVGLPYIINSNGGEVVGNEGRTTFTVPPGAYDSTKVMCVENYPIEEVESDLGSPVSEWGGQDIFLGGAKLVILNPNDNDNTLPHGIGLQEMVPAGMVVDTASNNSVYNLAPDQDGDGIPDIRLLGDLKFVDTPPILNKRSFGSSQVLGAMIFNPNRKIVLSGYRKVVYSNRTWIPKESETLESGMYVLLEGTGWSSVFQSDYRIGAVAGNDTSFLQLIDFVPSSAKSYTKITGCIIALPHVPQSTNIRIFIQSLLDNRKSNALDLLVLPPSVTMFPGIRDSVQVLLTKIDSIMTRSFRDSLFQRFVLRDGIDLEAYLQELRDTKQSILSLPDQNLANGYKFLQNAQVSDIYE